MDNIPTVPCADWYAEWVHSQPGERRWPVSTRSRTLLTPFLSVAVTASLDQRALANVLTEVALERPDPRSSPWSLGLELGGGLLRGGRRRDVVHRYHLRVGLPISYRSFYVKPLIELEHLSIDANRSSGQLRSAKLGPEMELTDGRAFRNLAVGLSCGAVVPASLLRKFTVVQFGASLEGRATLLRPRLRFNELIVAYGSGERDVEAVGNDNTEVTYRLWTLTVAGFATVRIDQLHGTTLRRMRQSAWLRPVANSATSASVGAMRFILDVDIEVNDAFRRYVQENPSERVDRTRPVLMLRQALPFSQWWGIEFLGALTQVADRWVYAFESVAMFRLTR